MYLKVNKGGQAESAAVISQADMKEAAENDGRLVQKLNERYYEARVRKETRTDGRPAEYEIENWIPLDDVPQEFEIASKQQPKAAQPSAPQGTKVEDLPAPQRQAMDPNFRNSAAGKDAADRVAAGNLALRDPVGQPHDGQPAPNDKQQPNQSRAGSPPAQSVVEQERLEQPAGPASERSKPAAPTPPTAGARTAPPPVPGPKAAPKAGEK